MKFYKQASNVTGKYKNNSVIIFKRFLASFRSHLEWSTTVAVVICMPVSLSRTSSGTNLWLFCFLCMRWNKTLECRNFKLLFLLPFSEVTLMDHRHRFMTSSLLFAYLNERRKCEVDSRFVIASFFFISIVYATTVIRNVMLFRYFFVTAGFIMFS